MAVIDFRKDKGFITQITARFRHTGRNLRQKDLKPFPVSRRKTKPFLRIFTAQGFRQERTEQLRSSEVRLYTLIFLGGKFTVWWVPHELCENEKKNEMARMSYTR